MTREEFRRLVSDMVLVGSAVGAVRYAKSTKRKVAKVEHMDRMKVAPAKINKKNNKIEKYYTHDNWQNTSTVKPQSYPAFGVSKTAPIEIFEIRPYKAGKIYYADPHYIAGLQYASLEEEIANFSNNHIKSGLSAGFVITFPDGKPEEKIRQETERRVQRKLTGSNNAGKVFLSWVDDVLDKPVIDAIPQNDNSEQWQFWANEARQQLLVAHRVTTPMLFGVKDNTGLGNNAKEMEEGSKLLNETTIRPKQNEFLNVSKTILAINNITKPLRFIPLKDEEEKEQETKDKKPEENNKEQKEEKKKEEKKVELQAQLALSDAADYLITLGEDLMDDFDELELRDVDGESMSEERLNDLFHFANVPSSGLNRKSEQDTSLFKIRYKYVGNPSPERKFCQTLMRARKLYRFEDLKRAERLVVNAGLGPRGANTYNIFLYKGGVNCKHWWQRVIYLKKNNKKIGVNAAKRLILTLDPKKRKDAKWEENPKQVAQIASPSNNHWKLK